MFERTHKYDERRFESFFLKKLRQGRAGRLLSIRKGEGEGEGGEEETVVYLLSVTHPSTPPVARDAKKYNTNEAVIRFSPREKESGVSGEKSHRSTFFFLSFLFYPALATEDQRRKKRKNRESGIKNGPTGSNNQANGPRRKSLLLGSDAWICGVDCGREGTYAGGTRVAASTGDDGGNMPTCLFQPMRGDR